MSSFHLPSSVLGSAAADGEALLQRGERPGIVARASRFTAPILVRLAAERSRWQAGIVGVGGGELPGDGSGLRLEGRQRALIVAGAALRRSPMPLQHVGLVGAPLDIVRGRRWPGGGEW